MPPYEALYGHKCRTPLCWLDGGERTVSASGDVVDSMEVVHVVRERMSAAQDRQARCADGKRRDVVFQGVGAHWISCLQVGASNRVGTDS